jgi:hypothetical protein
MKGGNSDWDVFGEATCYERYPCSGKTFKSHELQMRIHFNGSEI